MFQWRQLEAYNYFKSGFVRTVRGVGSYQRQTMHHLEKPGVSSPDTVHHPWKKNGDVVTAHCNGMAG